MSDPVEQWQEEAENARAWWNEEWAQFPTIELRDDGTPDYWAVGEDSGVYGDDWKTGQDLARGTVKQMQRFPEGSTVFRKIIAAMDTSSTISQGFLTRVEDMLTYPEIYLESLEEGAVLAKMRGENPQE